MKDFLKSKESIGNKKVDGNFDIEIIYAFISKELQFTKMKKAPDFSEAFRYILEKLIIFFLTFHFLGIFRHNYGVDHFRNITIHVSVKIVH